MKKTFALLSVFSLMIFAVIPLTAQVINTADGESPSITDTIITVTGITVGGLVIMFIVLVAAVFILVIINAIKKSSENKN